MRKARATFQGPDTRAFGSSAAELGAGTELDLPRGQSTDTSRRRAVTAPWTETLKLPLHATPSKKQRAIVSLSVLLKRFPGVR
jgi:hypothetical protein